MAQYCRYCEEAFRDHLTPCLYCRWSHKYMDRDQAKRTNKCKHFQLNPVDALRENVKGYQPTGRKIVQFGGMGKQVTLEEVMQE